MSTALRFEVAAIVCFALFVLLGARVSRRPLSRLDAQAVMFRGHLTPLAVIFTDSGRLTALTAACIVSIATYAALRIPILVPLLVSASQIVSQIVVEFCKTLFKRARPDWWHVGREAGHSYPSGHATTAVVFYLQWAIVVATIPLSFSVKIAIVAALCLWSLGVAWSRLALGAHYVTDICGGLLFGTGSLCAVFSFSAHFYGILR